MTPALPVEVVRLRRGPDLLPLPRYMTPGAAGMDLLADVTEDVVLDPGTRRLVPTGLGVAIPPGFEGQVRPRSGWATRDGLTVLNAPGTIDADYRGEVQVLLVNLGRERIRVRRGDRIAQLVIGPVVTVAWREVSALPTTGRGAGGFGSTDQLRGAPSGARPLRGLRSSEDRAAPPRAPDPPRRARQSRARRRPTSKRSND